MRRNCILHGSLVRLAFTLVCCTVVSVRAAEPISAVQKVLTGLKSPLGVAIRPDGSSEQYEIFIADSGTGRVVKIEVRKPEKTTEAVTGFARPSKSDEKPHPPGAQSLYFLDHSRLVVIGVDDDANPVARMYELPESETPLTADLHKADFELPAANEVTRDAPRAHASIARTQANDKVGDALIVSIAGGLDSEGLISIPVRANTLAEPTSVRVAGTSSTGDVGAITVAKSGYLVAATSSSDESDATSTLQFINPIDRRVAMQIPVDLSQIVALVCSPKTGNLYAANNPRSSADKAGIYRLDAADNQDQSACKATKIADIRRPVALAFGPDGSLYVTSSGETENEDSNGGALLRISIEP